MDEALFRFAEDEQRAYREQRDLSRYRAAGAEDMLDDYSDHGEHHVAEVMEQCALLWEALRPWLLAQGCTSPAAWQRSHLLLGAKYHDIGMRGSEARRALLRETDLLLARRPEPAELRALAERARQAGIDCRAARELGEMGRRSLLKSNWARLGADLHEEIKQQIRRRHALESGEWIAARRSELLERYGADTDVAAVALLAALHSGRFQGAERVVLGDDADGRAVAAFMRDFVQAHFPGEALSEARRREVVCLAALLRLADTRRSGSRMYAIDGARLRFQEEGGRLRAVRDYGDRQREIAGPVSHGILLGELAAEFGGVRLEKRDGGWLLTHEVTLRHAEDPGVREAFFTGRQESYLNELRTGMLDPRYGVAHRFRIHLEGLCAGEADQVAAGWNLRVAKSGWTPAQTRFEAAGG